MAAAAVAGDGTLFYRNKIVGTTQTTLSTKSKAMSFIRGNRPARSAGMIVMGAVSGRYLRIIYEHNY